MIEKRGPDGGLRRNLKMTKVLAFSILLSAISIISQMTYILLKPILDIRGALIFWGFLALLSMITSTIYAYTTLSNLSKRIEKRKLIINQFSKNFATSSLVKLLQLGMMKDAERAYSAAMHLPEDLKSLIDGIEETDEYKNAKYAITPVRENNIILIGSTVVISMTILTIVMMCPIFTPLFPKNSSSGPYVVGGIVTIAMLIATIIINFREALFEQKNPLYDIENEMAIKARIALEDQILSSIHKTHAAQLLKFNEELDINYDEKYSEKYQAKYAKPKKENCESRQVINNLKGIIDNLEGISEGKVGDFALFIEALEQSENACSKNNEDYLERENERIKKEELTKEKAKTESFAKELKRKELEYHHYYDDRPQFEVLTKGNTITKGSSDKINKKQWVESINKAIEKEKAKAIEAHYDAVRKKLKEDKDLEIRKNRHFILGKDEDEPYDPNNTDELIPMENKLTVGGLKANIQLQFKDSVDRWGHLENACDIGWKKTREKQKNNKHADAIMSYQWGHRYSHTVTVESLEKHMERQEENIKSLAKKEVNRSNPKSKMHETFQSLDNNTTSSSKNCIERS